MEIFTDRIAIVTGAASGIGRALALELAQRGAKVTLADVDTVMLDETLKSITRDRPRSHSGDMRCY